VALLTFPRDMPAAGAVTQDLKIRRIDVQTAEAGGRLLSVGVGFPLWTLTLELAAMDPAEANVWRAFVDTLRGAARTFYGRDLVRAFPKAHPGGFAGMTRPDASPFPANGRALSWSVNATRDELTLRGLPEGLTLSVGDLVGLAWTTSGEARRTIGRVVVGDVAFSLQGVATVAIEPPLPPFVPAGATAYLASPTLVMRIDPSQTAIGREDQIATEGGTIVAVQDLRA